MAEEFPSVPVRLHLSPTLSETPQARGARRCWVGAAFWLGVLALRRSRSEISGIRSPDMSCGPRAQRQWFSLAPSQATVWKQSLSLEPPSGTL